jgi:hypothetical protein
MKKLTLGRETLRTLSDRQLGAANGGKFQSLFLCVSVIFKCDTYSCNGTICNTDDLVTK